MTYGPSALQALGEPSRQAIVERLAAGPMAVGELALVLPISRPAVSQHLRVLQHAGLVTAQQDGTRRRYALDARGAAEVRAWLDRMWDRALLEFKAAVDQGSAG
jgi:DNA-binding transcriptional ArsR family regulator